MEIEIIKAGIADSLQDEGRFGAQQLGIQPTGCMDFVGATIANYLLGNSKNATVLECFFPSAKILFKEDTLFAICGADFQPTLNNIAIPLNQPVWANRNDILRFTKKAKGNCCYIAFDGGIQTANWLNSGSTNSVAGMGGFNGRLLQKEDTIPLLSKRKNKTKRTINWQVNTNNFYTNNQMIRVLPGPEWGWLTDDGKKIIANSGFSIDPNSNRMAYTLQGISLKQTKEEELVSSAVTKGTIQLLPSGKLMILMADHQTTGGYPRVLQVIKADLPSLVQQQFKSNISFSEVDIQTATNLLMQQEQDLLMLKNACMFKLDKM